MLLIAAFFPHHQAVVLLSLYVIGLLFAVVTSLVMNKISFREQPNPFVMELPPYRFPTFRNAVIHMWDKTAEWLKRVSTIVLLASIIIWGLGYFPHHPELSKEQQLEQSYLGTIGHAIEPAFSPMGQDWRTGVSLIAGAAAKEVIISSMAVTYGIDDEDIEDNSEPLAEHLRSLVDADGNHVMTEVSAFALMLFILLYFPCISTLGTIRQEIGRKWMWFSVIYNTSLAWIIGVLFYQIFK
jgi:ferrous iron transport protein B